MDYFYYRDWVNWPSDDVAAYADAIASHHGLSVSQRNYLRWKMKGECRDQAPSRDQAYPMKLTPGREEKARSIGFDDAAIHIQNTNLNRPYDPTVKTPQAKRRSIGGGLTERVWYQLDGEPMRGFKKMARRRRGRHPFLAEGSEIRLLCERARWLAECYPYDSELWLEPVGQEIEPHQGLIWYARSLRTAFDNAKRHIQRGDIEAGAWHAMHVGILRTELGIRIAHNANFEKYQIIQERQRHAGAASRKATDEEKRAAYFRYRADRHKCREAGHLAAQELGLKSEASIRNAFPGRVYPDAE